MIKIRYFFNKNYYHKLISYIILYDILRHIFLISLIINDNILISFKRARYDGIKAVRRDRNVSHIFHMFLENIFLGANQDIRDYSGRKARQYLVSQEAAVSQDTFHSKYILPLKEKIRTI